MTIDVSSLQTFTDADLLKIVKVAIAELTRYGKLVSIRERSVLRASLPELLKMRNELESRISAASGGRVFAYARRRRAT